MSRESEPRSRKAQAIEPESATIEDAGQPATAEPGHGLQADADPEGPEPDPVRSATLRERLLAAVSVGAWIGAALGFAGFLMVSVGWAPNTVIGEGAGPAIRIEPDSLMIGIALVSSVFGAVVAGVSRSLTTGAKPGTALSNSFESTVALGAATGLAIGLPAGGVVTHGLGVSVDAAVPMVEVAVLPMFGVLFLGGGLLGAITAGVVQLLGVPMGADVEQNEANSVRDRLKAAISVPVAAGGILILLVLPLAWILIQAFQFSHAAAPVIAIMVSVGILGFAALAGSKPNVRISFGEAVVAVVGVVAVVVIVLAVLVVRGPVQAEATGPGGEVEILAEKDISFDQSMWSVSEGPVTLVYEDEGDTVHTLTIEGLEDDLHLRVMSAGDVAEGTINLSPGTYTLYCDIRGHREAGMEGQLTVEDVPDPEE